MTAVTRLHRAASPATLAEASRRFLRRDAFEPTTRDAYGRTLTALADVVGADTDVAAVTTEQLEDELLARWANAAATTYNRHRAALLSFFGWCLDRGYLAANPAALVEPRKVRKRSEDERRERPISRDLLAELWTLDGVTGRDRLFWRMAYETWARADELLGLNIEDLDTGRREARVHGKGGDVETVWWATGTARLLPRVTADRTAGPLFLASRRPTQPMPAADVDPISGRARLSYRQAERIFAEAGRRLDPDGPPWTLHRLRHAGISHAVEDGYSVAAIRAKSRHESLRSLEIYTNPSADSIRAMTDDLDGTARRRRRQGTH
ncbi:tyrosine-type recombinase/integrase [Geodermatophilus sp. SYSU D00684]